MVLEFADPSRVDQAGIGDQKRAEPAEPQGRVSSLDQGTDTEDELGGVKFDQSSSSAAAMNTVVHSIRICHGHDPTLLSLP